MLNNAKKFKLKFEIIDMKY